MASRKFYKRSCLVKLPEGMKIFPVFHTSLLRAKPSSTGLPGQTAINEAESRNIQGRVLERDDETEEVTERWEFEEIQDVHDEDRKAGLTYLVKWRHHRPSWQPQQDLKGQEEVLYRFHQAHPNKPRPPAFVTAWAKKHPTAANTDSADASRSRGGLESRDRLGAVRAGLKRVTWAPFMQIRVF